MRREFSAGGVIIRRLRGRWHFAAIQAAGREVWALPKGIIGPDEKPVETALREAAEETGVETRPLQKLGDVRYVYTWQGERVFKVVSFFLLRYTGGRLGEIPAQHRHEVASTRWFPLEDGPAILAYKGEQEMAARALVFVVSNESQTGPTSGGREKL